MRYFLLLILLTSIHCFGDNQEDIEKLKRKIRRLERQQKEAEVKRQEEEQDRKLQRLNQQLNREFEQKVKESNHLANQPYRYTSKEYTSPTYVYKYQGCHFKAANKAEYDRIRARILKNKNEIDLAVHNGLIFWKRNVDKKYLSNDYNKYLKYAGYNKAQRKVMVARYKKKVDKGKYDFPVKWHPKLPTNKEWDDYFKTQANK